LELQIPIYTHALEFAMHIHYTLHTALYTPAAYRLAPSPCGLWATVGCGLRARL
jgi:hypothetical protein